MNKHPVGVVLLFALCIRFAPASQKQKKKTIQAGKEEYKEKKTPFKIQVLPVLSPVWIWLRGGARLPSGILTARILFGPPTVKVAMWCILHFTFTFVSCRYEAVGG
jgi:hypothetical protein